MEQILRVAIWSGWLRFSHLALGGSTLVLIVTGWLMQNAPSQAEAASDTHLLASSVLVFALLLRLALGLFGDPVARLGGLLPRPSEWPAVRAMLLFYVSLGRAPLPRWHAHNPLWKPLYLLLYLLLALLAVSGSLLPDQPLLLGWYLPSLHRELASVSAWLVLLHLLAVILHDYRGGSADVSAMINGNRYFTLDKPAAQSLEIKPLEIQPQASIRLDQIGGNSRKP